MPHATPIKRLSCGIVIFSPDAELLLCHVTNQSHWDLPKGGIDGQETAVQAALRETHEETGITLVADDLFDLGTFEYTAKKNLRLYSTCIERVDPATLVCASHYSDRSSGRQLPEMDGFGWFAFDRVAERCTPKLASVLTERIELAATFAAARARARCTAPA